MPPRPRPERRCHLCDKVFGKTEHLERHIRSHTKDKPFECNVCHKSFSRNDTLLRHWRSHQDAGPPPQSSVTTIRRANQSAAHQVARAAAAQAQTQTNNNQAGQAQQQQQSSAGQQPVQQQALPDFSSLNSYVYPPVDTQGFGQANVPDRHTEAASVLLSLPQSNNPSYTTNPQDGQADAQGFDQSGMSFQSGGGQDTNQHMLPDYNPMIDPSLSMTAAQGEATMNAQAEGQMDHQYESDQQNIDHQDFGHTDFITDHGLFDSRFQGPVEAHSSLIEEIRAIFKADDSFTMNGDHVQPKRNSNLGENIIWYGKADDNSSPSKPWTAMPHVDVDLINNCITKFFAGSSAVLPIIHAPTFRAEDKRLLTKAVTAIGSLNYARSFIDENGRKIFLELQSALDAAWKTDIVAGTPVDLEVVQAGFLTALFGFITGVGSNLADVESRRSSFATWAANLATIETQTLPTHGGAPGEGLEQTWTEWVRKEEQIRTLHGMRMLDAELANLFSRDPVITLDLSDIPQMAPDALFQAWTSQEWFTLLRTSNANYLGLSPKLLEKPENFYAAGATSRLTAASHLSILGSDIQQARANGTLDEAKVQELTDRLRDFYLKYLNQHPVVPGSDPLDLHIYWHATFITLLTDYHLFEDALGKRGEESATAASDTVRQWSSSEAAQRCLTHSVLIGHFASKIVISSQHPVYLPRCIYLAALSAIAYSEFASGDTMQGLQGLTFPEFDYVAHSMSLPAPPHAALGGDLLKYNLTEILPTTRVPLSSKFYNILSNLLFRPKKVSLPAPEQPTASGDSMVA